MQIGQFNRLRVLRESDIAYVLTDGTQEVFLHKKEAMRPYTNHEEIDVFLYVDNIGRITASTKQPLATIDHPGWLQVVSIQHQYGAFLHYGMVKDGLLSKDDLPLQIEKWPHVNDWIFCQLKEKKNHLFVKQVARKMVRETLQPQTTLAVKTTVEAIVCYFLSDGLVLFTKEGHELFVHYNQTRKDYRLGETVEARILSVHDNHEYVASLIGQKETMFDVDSQRILEYLQHHNGQMRFTDRSSPEDIQAAFRMSKGAFKRALGTLYKAGLILLNEETTQLKT